MIVLLLLTIYVDNIARLPVGVQSCGTGGITTLIDEGLFVFHNPAMTKSTKFNFTLSRWLYQTNGINIGISHRNYAAGISYLSYGTLQGYDEYGFPTNRFSPYDLNIGVSRGFGNFGICVRSFQTAIDSVLFWGFAGCLGSLVNLGRIEIGAKIDNIGKEIIHGVEIPPVLATGIKFLLPENFQLLVEAKGIDFELSSGIAYEYQNLRIFSGVKYVAPDEFAGSMSIADCSFSGGIVLSFEEYELGYSFVYTEFSNAHQIGIVFTPE